MYEIPSLNSTTARTVTLPAVIVPFLTTMMTVVELLSPESSRQTTESGYRIRSWPMAYEEEKS